jgi:hypothetical protein
VTKIYEIDPVKDIRWPQLLEQHKLAAVFHSKEWLDALQRTYGYRPSALTTSNPGEYLTNALVFCRVRSWLTGRRLVSVPFSDHCTPLVDSEEELTALLSGLKRERDDGRENYLEVRSVSGDAGAAGDPGEAVEYTGSTTFCLHRLDLGPSLKDLFHSFHASCIRRKIVRAEREGVTYEEGTSEEFLQRFYQLAVLTRRRQQIPPQPLAWFRNLVACMGDQVKIRLASQSGQPAAGILTIRYKNTMIYKYGCSDPRFHRIGSMQLLMWKTIQDAKNEGLLEFDMGRTDWKNKGLLIYKDRWGGVRSTLTYFRYPAAVTQTRSEALSMRVAKRMIAVAPGALLTAAGRVLYRHIA